MNWSRVRWTAVVTLAAGVVAACGAGASGSAVGPVVPPGHPSTSEIDAAVLDPWKTFPVSRRPRPLVLLTQVPIGSGSGDAKVAAMSGSFVLATTLPPGPADAVVQLPGGPVRLGLVGAQQALSAASRGPQPAGPSTAAVQITRATLGTDRFSTDRGQVELPAWIFTVAGGPGQIVWPAIEESAFWRPKAPALDAGPPASRTATTSGRDLTVEFDGPPDPCPGEPVYRYEVASVSSTTAVAVSLRAVPTGSREPGKAGSCEGSALGTTAKYSLTLAEPLGNRVLLGAGGRPIPVTGP